MNGKRRRRRVVKDPARRRSEILETAAQMLESYRYDELSMQMICDELSIAKGTLYHYFSSKEQLLEEASRLFVDKDIEEKMLIVCSDTFLELTAMEQMKLLFSIGVFGDRSEDLPAHLYERGQQSYIRQLGEYIVRFSPIFAQVIERGCREGVFRTDFPLESAELLLTGLQCLTDTGVYPWEAEDLLRRSAAIPSLIENQLVAPAGVITSLDDEAPGSF